MINLNHRRFWALILLSVVSAIIVSCGGDDKPLYSEADVEATVTARLAEEKVSSPKPVKSPTPKVVKKEKPASVPTAAPKKDLPLTPADIFESVSPSIAYIDTKSSSGSGILTSDGFIVTNAHVIWPDRVARVVFPDKSEFENVPVVAWDLTLDIALLGPLAGASNLPEIASWSNDDDLVIGEEVFLIGYPGESSDFPDPSITRGIISNLREFPLHDLSFVQTDASIAGGQSGGALVTSDGEILGLSGYTYTESMFGMAMRASDLSRIVERLQEKRPFVPVSERKFDYELLGTDVKLEIGEGAVWNSIGFFFEANNDQVVDIDVSTSDFSKIILFDPLLEPIEFNGEDLYSVPGDIGSENDVDPQKLSIKSHALVPGKYFLTIIPFMPNQSIEIQSNLPINRINEKDKDLKYVDLWIGSGHYDYYFFDYPGDIDSFELLVADGANVEILTHTIALDPFFTLFTFSDDEGDPKITTDDDSGEGLFGSDPMINLSTAVTGNESHYHYLRVEDNWFGVGGYFLQAKIVGGQD